MQNIIFDIGVSLLASVVLLAASVLLHYNVMIWTRSRLSGSGLRRPTGALVGMFALVAAQLIAVLIYALAYFGLGLWGGLGSLAGQIEGGFIDPLYFSLMSYTTLGVGDIYPLGGFRIISGVEALNGFAMIGWTASFAYTLFRDGWHEPSS
ncbi:ion channel [uncultured Devosia sp.]|uniref:ion channel n=1 Tax=uncultured Devosia sp. TaxID=211434 RepID=UPI002616BE17|nr:ion channel [uncultured Devosia sp.]